MNFATYVVLTLKAHSGWALYALGNSAAARVSFVPGGTSIASRFAVPQTSMAVLRGDESGYNSAILFGVSSRSPSTINLA